MGPDLKTSTVKVYGIEFGLLAAAGNPLMITFNPERIEETLKGRILTRSRVITGDDGGMIAGIIAAELEFFPDFTANPLLATATPLQKKVWRQIMAIKRGETKTYGEIAAALGNPGLARAVGRACNANPLALIIPCHRVVAKNNIGGFAGPLAAKKTLLRLEEVNLNS